MSERPTRAYDATPAGAAARAPDAQLRRYTEEPAGPLELLVMHLGRALHDAERPGGDWFGLVGSSVEGFCRRAMEARGLEWSWVREAIERERLDERTTKR